jgi:hypothetical protein
MNTMNTMTKCGWVLLISLLTLTGNARAEESDDLDLDPDIEEVVGINPVVWEPIVQRLQIIQGRSAHRRMRSELALTSTGNAPGEHEAWRQLKPLVELTPGRKAKGFTAKESVPSSWRPGKQSQTFLVNLGETAYDDVWAERERREKDPSRRPSTDTKPSLILAVSEKEPLYVFVDWKVLMPVSVEKQAEILMDGFMVREVAVTCHEVTTEAADLTTAALPKASRKPVPAKSKATVLGRVDPPGGRNWQEFDKPHKRALGPLEFTPRFPGVFELRVSITLRGRVDRSQDPVTKTFECGARFVALKSGFKPETLHTAQRKVGRPDPKIKPLSRP